jgi:hypothetical protein
MTVAEEAQRYLEVVEVFRREGCEPHWRPEWRERPELSGRSRRTSPSLPRRKEKWSS